MSVDEGQVRHVADTGLFVWIGGPQSETAEPSKFDTMEQLAQAEGITFIISQQVYDELTVDVNDGYTTSAAGIDDAIEAGWVEVYDSLDFTLGPVSTILDRGEELIKERDEHHREDDDARADASILAIAAQMLETEQADQVTIYTTDRAQRDTAQDVLNSRYGDRINIHYCVEYLMEGIDVDAFHHLWRE